MLTLIFMLMLILTLMLKLMIMLMLLLMLMLMLYRELSCVCCEKCTEQMYGANVGSKSLHSQLKCRLS
jgi:hypothetical protein